MECTRTVNACTDTCICVVHGLNIRLTYALAWPIYDSSAQ